MSSMWRLSLLRGVFSGSMIWFSASIRFSSWSRLSGESVRLGIALPLSRRWGWLIADQED